MRRMSGLLVVLAVGAMAGRTWEQDMAGSRELERAAVWEPLRFLVGNWTGEGSGKPGEGKGGFSFTWDLEERILIRRNHAEYPATKDRPAFSHEDLMVIYREADREPLKAIYFDNEGHVIHYAVSVTEQGNKIQCVSDSIGAGPRYRLTYMKDGSNSLKLKFEIAPPGRLDTFATYLEARARRE